MLFLPRYEHIQKLFGKYDFSSEKIIVELHDVPNLQFLRSVFLSEIIPI